MNDRTNNQRILDNHGNITQNGDIYEFNNANIFNINIPYDLDFYIKSFKKLTENSKIYKIVILTSYIDPIKDIDKLFENIEEFVYSSENLNLQVYTYHQINNDELSKSSMIIEKRIVQELEKYIYSQKKLFFENKINNLNYTRFYFLINEINKFKKNEESYECNIEYKIMELTKIFFRNNLLPIEYCNSNEYFAFLEKNNIDFITKDFKPTSIKNYLYHKRNQLIDYSCGEWELTCKELYDTDCRIMVNFMLRKDNKYEKTIIGLKKFILDYNLISEMCEDIEGMKPYSLYDICNLKSLFDENSTLWGFYLSHEDVLKEYM